jgi:curved DNA-binding protein
VRARGEDLHHRIDLTVEELFRGGERQLQLQLPDGAGGPTTRTLTVKIPPGLAEGEPIRLRGQGMPGSGGEPAGDLYLEAAVAPHPFYRLDGRDVLVDLPLAPWEAALGAQVPAPTLGGTLTVTIPPGAQDGQKLRLRGRGLPGDPAGDQYLVLRIAMPPAADAAAKTLWRQLAAAAPFNPRAKLGV